MKPRINLHADEKMLFECKPDKKLIAYLFFTRGHFYILIPLMLFASYIFFGTHFVTIFANWLSYLIVALIAVSALSCAWLTFALNRHWYFFTSSRCIIYSGYWGVNKKVIPYNRIVDINMNRNPMRAILGIAAIYIVQQGVASQYTRGMGQGTQGISANMAIIDGLTPALAEQISDLVSQQMSNVK